MQHDLNSTNANMIRQSQEMHEMSMTSLRAADTLNDREIRGSAQGLISVPIQINGENFMLELDNIQNIDVIDLNEPVKSSENIIDQINNDQPD